MAEASSRSRPIPASDKTVIPDATGDPPRSVSSTRTPAGKPSGSTTTSHTPPPRRYADTTGTRRPASGCRGLVSSTSAGSWPKPRSLSPTLRAPPAWTKARSRPGPPGTDGAAPPWSPTPSLPSPQHSNAACTPSATHLAISSSYPSPGPDLLRLLRLPILPQPRRDGGHVLHWSTWRRHHQQRARACHLHWHAYADTTP